MEKYPREVIAALVTVAACGSSHGTACPDAAPPYCVEAELTIAQGVYGQVVAVEDVGRCGGSYPAFDIQIDLRNPFGTSTLASAASDSAGVYQIAYAAGDYAVCLDPRCVAVTVPSNGLVRVDGEQIFQSVYIVSSPSC